MNRGRRSLPAHPIPAESDLDADLGSTSPFELARQCLAGMRVSAAAIADYGVDELASQSLGRMRAERLSALDADPEAPPFFGRTDRDPEPPATDTEVFHIGRRHVRDQRGEPVVIDWRAPIARAFYRASPTERMGVRLRRRFGFHDGRLSSFEDEHLDLGEQLGLDSDLLRQEIERPRVGPMRDIVATIQPDQDDLVRADLDTSLCIQGGPGHGQDRRRPAPCGVPALHLSGAAPALRRSGGWPEPGVPALHRTGAAVPG